MDWSKQAFIKVAFLFSYIGENYKGLVQQSNTPDTVEHHLFQALLKTCLIRDKHSCVYTRCGRTDKGVSALGNVCCLYVRKIKEGQPSYCQMLNRVLPEDIRVIRWAKVDHHFDARFSCVWREYKYFFLQGNMDVEGKLKRAAEKLVGVHDFRNFCKKDTSVVSAQTLLAAGEENKEEIDDESEEQSFIRKIYRFEAQLVAEGGSSSKFSTWVCVIRGSAFLWHQVRCMMAVLFMVANGEEPEEIVDQLLDVEKVKERPNYFIAEERGLILASCGFEGVQWENSLSSDLDTFRLLKRQLEERSLARCLVQEQLSFFDGLLVDAARAVQEEGLWVEPFEGREQWLMEKQLRTIEELEGKVQPRKGRKKNDNKVGQSVIQRAIHGDKRKDKKQ